jgi:RNA polymerase sigma-70 factor (ECF subfamily)
MDTDPDLPWVRDLSSEDPERRRAALGALFARHQQGVFNVAWRVLGDWAAAQDVTQEVFLHLADRIASFRGEASLSSWLYRIVVNRAIDARRHETRRPAWRSGSTPPEAGAARPASVDGPPEVAEPPEDDARAKRVRAALARLSPKLRAIAVLRYVEGLSYESLAEVLNCSMGTVKSRLNRAHAALARELGGRPGPSE